MDNKVWKVFTILLLLVFIFSFGKQVNAQIDPNACDYTLNSNYLYTWSDLPASADSFSLGDDDYAQIDFTAPELNFHFTFYGLPVETLYISSNGYLTLKRNVAIDRINNDLNSRSSPLDILAPFWDDLKPGSGGKIYAWLDSNSPRRYIIRWDSVGRWWLSSSECISFEAILYEGTNQIVFQYEDVKFAPNGDDEYSYGQSASVGLRSERDNQLFSQQYSYNQSLLQDKMAISFTVAGISDEEAPFVTDCSPKQYAVNVTSDPNVHTDPNNPFIRFTLQDPGSGVDTSTIDVSISLVSSLSLEEDDITNEGMISILPLDDDRLVHVSYFPSMGFPRGQNIKVEVDAADKAASPNWLLDYFYFFKI